MDGNSLSNRGEDNGAAVPNTHTLARLIIAGLTGIKPPVFSKGISAKTTRNLIDDFPTKIAPYVRSGDIYFFWEISNDMANGQTPLQAYNNLITITTMAKALGMIVVQGTMIARNLGGDPVDLEANRLSINSMLVSDHSFCDGFVDMGGLTEFNSIAAISNTTYYNDGAHLKLAGTQLIANAVVPIIQSLL
jgi:hypothetical protein